MEPLNDNFLYTLEFRAEGLEKSDADNLLNILKNLQDVKYKEYSKLPKNQAQKTTI